MSKTLCGVDLGGYSIKCSRGDGKAVKRLWQARTHPGQTSRRDRLNQPEWESRAAATLREARKNGSLSSENVVFQIQGYRTHMGYLSLPELQGPQLETAVKAAVSRELAFGIKESAISFLEVPSLEEGKNGYLWVASSIEQARALIRIAQQSGLQLSRLEVPAMSIARSVNRNHKLDSETWYAVISVGFNVTSIVLAKRGVPYFSRDFWMAGGEFTQAAVQGFGCSWEEAERRKLEYDVTKRHPVFEPVVGRWLAELERTRLFAAGRGNYVQPETVYLVGGSSRWTGLAERTQEVASAPVVVEDWSTLRKPRTNDPDFATYAAALGLATTPRVGKDLK